MKVNLKVKVTGINDVKKALKRLPDELQKAAYSAALRAGGKPILKEEKARVPVDDGLLKKSLGIMLVGKGKKVAVKIGVREGFKGRSLGFKMSKKGKTKGQMTERFQDPSYYSHLVELGTPHAPAQPFIRPAIDAAQGETLAAMASGLDKHLTRVAERVAAKKKK